MLNSLLAYQSTICSYSRKFRPGDWLSYDIAFCRHAPHNHALAWDNVDEDAYDSFLRDRNLPSCNSCNAHGHFASNCPVKLLQCQHQVRITLVGHMRLIAPVFVPNSTQPETFVQPQPPPVPLLKHNHASQSTEPATVSTAIAWPLVPTTATNLIVGSPAQSDKSDFALDTIELNSLPPFCSTPVHIARLEKELTSHPDREFVASILYDSTFGFDIGCNGPRFPRLVQNLLSVRNNPKVVQNYLKKEVSQNRVAGPFKSPPLQNLQCSLIGLVPKKDGSWQMIMDLSASKGSSMNDFISQEEFSVIYSKLDDAVNMIAKLGPGLLSGYA